MLMSVPKLSTDNAPSTNQNKRLNTCGSYYKEDPYNFCHANKWNVDK